MKFQNETISSRLSDVRLVAMDVDGVLTDGRITYSSSGDEVRSFHVSDGLGIVLLQQMGIEVAWISGRKSSLVERRAAELNVRHVVQCVQDKGLALTQLAIKLVLDTEQIAFVADDWNDLPAFDYSGVKIAVANADPYVMSRADAITECRGGEGAVREIVNAIIEAKGTRNEIVESYIEILHRNPLKSGSGQ